MPRWPFPLFYLPAMFFGSRTNFTVVDMWRFWIIHLWVEGFFELFVTVMVAVIFYQAGHRVAAHGDARGLPRRDPVPRERYRRHRPSLVLDRPVEHHHGPRRGFLRAGSRAADAAYARRLGLHQGDARRAKRLGQGAVLPHKWTFYFLMSVGFWNFLGAGVFGFLINMPIVSYFEVGTILTPNHGHAAMMGVFGMLAVALMVFAMRQVLADEQWKRVEKYVRVSFWGLNIGLASDGRR